MLKQTLLSIAQQATVKAIFETAEALATQGLTWGIPNGASVNHWAAAATYATVAAVAGGAGLGMSAAGVGKTGGGAGRSSRQPGQQNNYRPDFAQTRKEKKEVTVNLYFENNKDPAALAIGNSRVVAQIASQMAA
jgi:hypothetical protein